MRCDRSQNDCKGPIPAAINTKTFPNDSNAVARDRKTLRAMENSSRGPSRVVFQRKCVAIGPKTIATDRSQLRSTQKLFPTTQTLKRSCPPPKNAANDAKIPPADPAELFSTQMRCDQSQNGCSGPIAAAFDTKTLPADPKGVARNANGL